MEKELEINKKSHDQTISSLELDRNNVRLRIPLESSLIFLLLGS